MGPQDFQVVIARAKLNVDYLEITIGDSARPFLACNHQVGSHIEAAQTTSREDARAVRRTVVVVDKKHVNLLVLVHEQRRALRGNGKTIDLLKAVPVGKEDIK